MCTMGSSGRESDILCYTFVQACRPFTHSKLDYNICDTGDLQELLL